MISKRSKESDLEFIRLSKVFGSESTELSMECDLSERNLFEQWQVSHQKRIKYSCLWSYY